MKGASLGSLTDLNLNAQPVYYSSVPFNELFTKNYSIFDS